MSSNVAPLTQNIRNMLQHITDATPVCTDANEDERQNAGLMHFMDTALAFGHALTGGSLSAKFRETLGAAVSSLNAEQRTALFVAIHDDLLRRNSVPPCRRGCQRAGRLRRTCALYGTVSAAMSGACLYPLPDLLSSDGTTAPFRRALERVLESVVQDYFHLWILSRGMSLVPDDPASLSFMYGVRALASHEEQRARAPEALGPAHEMFVHVLVSRVPGRGDMDAYD